MDAMILVACHKPCEMYNKGIYTPIQVGKAISEYNLGIIGDDTGDNISQKNPSYCELTAQYWAWKNVDCRYIGLCHYRRYFETVYTNDLLERIFSKYDVILPRPVYYGIRETMLHKLRMNILPEDCAIFLLAIRKLYPEYEKSTLLYRLHNQMKIHHDSVVDMIGNHTKKQNWIRKELSVLFRQSPASSFDDIIKTSVLVGMKNDGIL